MSNDKISKFPSNTRATSAPASSSVPRSANAVIVMEQICGRSLQLSVSREIIITVENLPSAYSKPFTLGYCFQRTSLLFLCVLLVVQAQAPNARSKEEVQVLDSFRQQMQATLIISEIPTAMRYWASWNSTDDTPCAWVGVICTANGTVEELSLSGWSLFWDSNGTINLQILFNLTDLLVLDLSSNLLGQSFRGPEPIPSNIGNFTRLLSLDLSRNGFGGEIPPSISACRNLQFLYLEENLLQGEIPSLVNMVNLQVLSLADNQLTGQFPKEVRTIRTLINIDLSGNLLNGIIPSLPNLTHLLGLGLQNNNFSRFDEPWSIGSRLEQLTVSENLLEGKIPPAIANLMHLQYLNMSRNRLSGSIPYGFSRMQSRNSFWWDFSQNQLNGSIPADLLQPSPEIFIVGFLNLSHNSLTGSIPYKGSVKIAYYALDLSHNQLSGNISFMYRNSSTRLARMWLGNNFFSGDIVDLFAAGPGFNLTFELHLNNNGLTGDLSKIVDNWSNTTHLEVLDLSNNNLQMSTTDGLSKILNVNNSKMRELRLAGNNFSGTSLPTERFTNPQGGPFQILDLSNCHLKGGISTAAFGNDSMPSLQFLNISHNEVTGPIPHDILKLRNLTVLDVSNNSLSGPLPALQPNSALYNPTFFQGNDGLCGVFFSPCRTNGSQSLSTRSTGVPWWIVFIIVGGCVLIAIGSCLIATWRWRVYRKRHQYVADLIKALRERDSASLMPLRELKRATDNFAQNAWLGEGGFGTVYAGTLSDGTKVAIKRSKRMESERHKQQFLNEVRILTQVNHRYLVKLLGCCMEKEVSLLVFEFVPNGTLLQHLQGKLGTGVLLTWIQRLNIAVQTADALNYLHSAAAFPIYHRDVKSANILLTDDLNAKVADFGISKLAPVEATHISTAAVRGTLGYIDPEYYTSYQLTDKSDVYSFGVVLLELISAKPAVDVLRGGDEANLVTFAYPYFEGGNLEGLLDPALTETYYDPTGEGRDSICEVGKLAMKCVAMRSKARPSMKEVWKRLQNLWLEFDGTLQPSGSLNEDEIPESDQGVLLYESFSGNSSTFSLPFQGGDIEMSQSSTVRYIRSRSTQ